MEAREDRRAVSRGGGGVSAELRTRLRRIHIIAGVVALAWLLATSAIGLWQSNRNIADRLDEAARVALADTNAVAVLADRMFHELAAIPAALAASRGLHDVIIRYNARDISFSAMPEDERRRQLRSDADVVRLGTGLAQICKTLGYDLILALDSRGILVVSSESENSASRLGMDLNDREYFRTAMAGRIGSMFAISRISISPGFFFAAPIDEKGVALGAVVIQQAGKAVGSLLHGSRIAWLIVDNKGMVVASSQPEFYLRHVSLADRAHLSDLTKVDEAPNADTLRKIYAQEGLREAAILRSARSSPLDAPVHDWQRVIDGRTYLVTTDPLKAYAEYSLFVLSPIDWVAEVRQRHLVDIAVVALFGVLAILSIGRGVANLARRHEFAQVTAALNKKLTAANMEKNRFLGIAAHDLRNPLSSIRGLSQLLVEHAVEQPEQDEFLETIHRTSDEMLRLVNDLLDVAVIESGKLDLKRKEQDLVTLVQQRIDHLEPQARGKKIDLRLDADGMRPASIDGARFSQVIDNLVSNAIKFSPSGTLVHVSLRAADGKFTFRVQDEGPGLSDADKGLLFKSFQKLSARPTGGEKSTGLGLAIVKRIVDAHGGSIEVESALGKGTCFTVTIPIAPP